MSAAAALCRGSERNLMAGSFTAHAVRRSQDNLWYVGPPALAWAVLLGTTFKLREDYVMSHRH